MAVKSYEIDMCRGPLLGKILRFSFPLMLSSILQLLFNAADVITVGQFAGKEAMAAVGSTTSLYNLIINVFVGLATGSSVLMARFYGSKDKENCKEIVHTSVLLAIVCGIALIFIGIVISPVLLSIMGTPDDVLAHAVLYMRIIFIGMPVLMLYNFGAGILRAVGDTKRPLIYLTIAGIVNVVLNLTLVIVFDMGVAGVAIGTIVSQAISAVMILRCLMKDEGLYHLNIRELRIAKDKLSMIVKVGLPAGIQGALFSISNVILQASINTFGSTAMAGSAASQNIENFVYVSMNSLYQACISFTSQNFGAGEKKRVLRVLWLCLASVVAVGVITGGLATLFGHQLLSIYSGEADVIAYGYERLVIVCLPYFLCGIMDVACGALRGIGLSVIPTLVSLAGACGLRILWVCTIFQLDRTIFTLYMSYPVSWAVTFAAHMVCFVHYYRRWANGESMHRRHRSLSEIAH